MAEQYHKAVSVAMRRMDQATSDFAPLCEMQKHDAMLPPVMPFYRMEWVELRPEGNGK
jgi:hypothetical protein